MMTEEIGEMEAKIAALEAKIELGRVVALYYHSSTSYHIH
jgi:hypothetical protein